MSVLRLEGVRKRFGAVEALAGIDLSVAQGSRTAIVGASGSGKTTLLRIIAGFEMPDSGRVSLGETLLADGVTGMPAHRRGIGIVAQDGALFPHLTIGENIGFGMPRDAPRRADDIAALMRMVGLDAAMLARKPDQVSGGQQQRVALARALARKPKLMLLDEPFSALDTALRASTRKAVADVLGAAGITTILVTHDQAEALSFADQVAVMRAGRLAQVGTPREVYAHPCDADIAEFMGEAVLLPAHVEKGVADCALGRIPVRGDHNGAATLMLRPEQILLTDAAETSGGGIVADVVEVDFAGAFCAVVLNLGNRASAPISIRRSFDRLPAVGSRAVVTLVGEGHAIASRSACIATRQRPCAEA